MIVPAMNSKELLTEIYNDFKIVYRKATYLGLSLRRDAVKSKTKYVQRVFDYKSLRNNDWFIVVDYYVARPSFTAVVYYLDQYGLNGIKVNGNNPSLTHFTPHFLDRYNERFLKHESLPKLELLKRFITMNSFEVIRFVPDSETANNRIFGRFKEGIGLGFKEVYCDNGKEILHYKTFISTDMIFESQEEDFNLTGKHYDLYWNEMHKNTRQRA